MKRKTMFFIQLSKVCINSMVVVSIIFMIQHVHAGVRPLQISEPPVIYTFMNALQVPPNCTLEDYGRGEVRGLLIGINEYASEELLDLRGSVNDVKLLHQALMGKGVKSENITTLTNAEAKGINILTQLDNLLASTGCGDFIFLHFSGAGYSGQRIKGMERLRYNPGTLLLSYDTPIDTTQGSLNLSQEIWGQNLAAAMVHIRNKGANIFLSADADLAEGLDLATRQNSLGKSTIWHWEPRDKRSQDENSFPGLFLEAGDFTIFYGAPFDEPVYEKNVDEKYFGQFTFALAHVIQASRQKTTVRELANQVLSFIDTNKFNLKPIFEASDPEIPFLGINSAIPSSTPVAVTFEMEELSRGDFLKTTNGNFELHGTIQEVESKDIEALFVNEQEVHVAKDGSFFSNILLAPGPNYLVVHGFTRGPGVRSL